MNNEQLDAHFNAAKLGLFFYKKHTFIKILFFFRDYSVFLSVFYPFHENQ